MVAATKDSEQLRSQHDSFNLKEQQTGDRRQCQRATKEGVYKAE